MDKSKRHLTLSQSDCKSQSKLIVMNPSNSEVNWACVGDMFFYLSEKLVRMRPIELNLVVDCGTIMQRFIKAIKRCLGACHGSKLPGTRSKLNRSVSKHSSSSDYERMSVHVYEKPRPTLEVNRHPGGVLHRNARENRILARK